MDKPFKSPYQLRSIKIENVDKADGLSSEIPCSKSPSYNLRTRCVPKIEVDDESKARKRRKINQTKPEPVLEYTDSEVIIIEEVAKRTVLGLIELDSEGNDRQLELLRCEPPITCGSSTERAPEESADVTQNNDPCQGAVKNSPAATVRMETDLRDILDFSSFNEDLCNDEYVVNLWSEGITATDAAYIKHLQQRLNIDCDPNLFCDVAYSVQEVDDRLKSCSYKDDISNSEFVKTILCDFVNPSAVEFSGKNSGLNLNSQDIEKCLNSSICKTDIHEYPSNSADELICGVISKHDCLRRAVSPPVQMDSKIKESNIPVHNINRDGIIVNYKGQQTSAADGNLAEAVVKISPCSTFSSSPFSVSEVLNETDFNSLLSHLDTVDLDASAHDGNGVFVPSVPCKCLEGPPMQCNMEVIGIQNDDEDVDEKLIDNGHNVYLENVQHIDAALSQSNSIVHNSLVDSGVNNDANLCNFSSGRACPSPLVQFHANGSSELNHLITRNETSAIQKTGSTLNYIEPQIFAGGNNVCRQIQPASAITTQPHWCDELQTILKENLGTNGDSIFRSEFEYLSDVASRSSEMWQRVPAICAIPPKASHSDQSLSNVALSLGYETSYCQNDALVPGSSRLSTNEILMASSPSISTINGGMLPLVNCNDSLLSVNNQSLETPRNSVDWSKDQLNMFRASNALMERRLTENKVSITSNYDGSCVPQLCDSTDLVFPDDTDPSLGELSVLRMGPTTSMDIYTSSILPSFNSTFRHVLDCFSMDDVAPSENFNDFQSQSLPLNESSEHMFSDDEPFILTIGDMEAPCSPIPEDIEKSFYWSPTVRYLNMEPFVKFLDMEKVDNSDDPELEFLKQIGKCDAIDQVISAEYKERQRQGLVPKDADWIQKLLDTNRKLTKMTTRRNTGRSAARRVLTYMEPPSPEENKPIRGTCNRKRPNAQTSQSKRHVKKIHIQSRTTSANATDMNDSDIATPSATNGNAQISISNKNIINMTIDVSAVGIDSLEVNDPLTLREDMKLIVMECFDKCFEKLTQHPSSKINSVGGNNAHQDIKSSKTLGNPAGALEELNAVLKDFAVKENVTYWMMLLSNLYVMDIADDSDLVKIALDIMKSAIELNLTEVILRKFLNMITCYNTYFGLTSFPRIPCDLFLNSKLMYTFLMEMNPWETEKFDGHLRCCSEILSKAGEPEEPVTSEKILDAFIKEAGIFTASQLSPASTATLPSNDTCTDENDVVGLINVRWVREVLHTLSDSRSDAGSFSDNSGIREDSAVTREIINLPAEGSGEIIGFSSRFSKEMPSLPAGGSAVHRELTDLPTGGTDVTTEIVSLPANTLKTPETLRPILASGAVDSGYEIVPISQVPRSRCDSPPLDIECPIADIESGAVGTCNEVVLEDDRNGDFGGAENSFLKRRLQMSLTGTAQEGRSAEIQNTLRQLSLEARHLDLHSLLRYFARRDSSDLRCVASVLKYWRCIDLDKNLIMKYPAVVASLIQVNEFEAEEIHKEASALMSHIFKCLGVKEMDSVDLVRYIVIQTILIRLQQKKENGTI